MLKGYCLQWYDWVSLIVRISVILSSNLPSIEWEWFQSTSIFVISVAWVTLKRINCAFARWLNLLPWSFYLDFTFNQGWIFLQLLHFPWWQILSSEYNILILYYHWNRISVTIILSYIFDRYNETLIQLNCNDLVNINSLYLLKKVTSDDKKNSTIDN